MRFRHGSKPRCLGASLEAVALRSSNLTAPVGFIATSSNLFDIELRAKYFFFVRSSDVASTRCRRPHTRSASRTPSSTAATGSTFAGWSGGGCSGTGTCVTTVNADTTVTATFTLDKHTLTVSSAGNGGGSRLVDEGQVRVELRRPWARERRREALGLDRATDGVAVHAERGRDGGRADATRSSSGARSRRPSPCTRCAWQRHRPTLTRGQRP